jgi:hypothetical protein
MAKENAMARTTMKDLPWAMPIAAASIAASIWLFPTHGRLMVGGANILPWLLPGTMAIALAEGIVLSLRPRGYDWRA